MSIGIIIQARTTSTRLPNKVVMPFYDKKSIIEILIDRISAIHNYPIVLATTSNISDDVLINVAKSKGVQTFRGDEHNVLQRFIGCAEQYAFNSIIRVCADNPFLDVQLIEPMVIILQLIFQP
jgi:spore coat polysaccharide biosynthesis protein SpsF